MKTATLEKPDGTSLVLRRTFSADRQRLWKALTDPVAWKDWFGSGRATPVSTEADLRPGGAYRIEMRGNESGETHVIQGEFTEVRRPDFVSFTWAWYTSPDRVSHVSYRLIDGATPEETVLILTHDRFYDTDARDGHGQGWSASLEKLAEVLS